MKKLIGFILIVSLIVITTTGAFAHTVTTTKSDIIGTYTYEMTDTSSKVLHSQQFVRYLTESWAYASSYTWSKANIATIGFTGNISDTIKGLLKSSFSLTGSYTTSYTVAITLPANSSTYSKLGFYSDFYWQDFSVKVTYSTAPYHNAPVQTTVSNYSTTAKEPTRNTYLKVVYL